MSDEEERAHEHDGAENGVSAAQGEAAAEAGAPDLDRWCTDYVMEHPAEWAWGEDDAAFGRWLADAIRAWQAASAWHQTEAADRAIDELAKRTQEVGAKFANAPKIRPRTFEEGHHYGLIEAIALLRKRLDEAK